MRVYLRFLMLQNSYLHIKTYLHIECISVLKHSQQTWNWKIELCYTALFCDWLRAYTKIATSLDVQVNYNTCLKIIFILSLEQHKQMWQSFVSLWLTRFFHIISSWGFLLLVDLYIEDALAILWMSVPEHNEKLRMIFLFCLVCLLFT